MNKILKSVFFITLVIFAAFFIAACPGDDNGNGEDAVEFVKGIKLGWNLGNTLDAGFRNNPSDSVTTVETAWVKHVTNKSNMEALKNAGFNAVRIPISWNKVVDAANEYKIREDWMKRVTEIVDYAVAYDMYVIINTHHDENIFKFMNSDYEAGLAAFEKIWKQIAENFKKYDEKLIFEGLNEPRTPGSSAQWSGGTSEERENLNKYYQVFVDTVRKTGGNNNKRFLLIATYAASVEKVAIDGLVLPNDTVDNKLIVSVHYYSPYNFALNTNATFNTWSKDNPSDTSSIINGIDRAYNKFVINGIPVILGEFGAMNKNNDDARAAWAEFYVGYAKEKEIPCFWWDNAVTSGSGEKFGLLNRADNTIAFPKVLEGLKKGAGIVD